jgi:hypothetical protein
MIEPRGRAARWQTALLLIPGAAVTFGAAVEWAAGTTPATSSVMTTTQPVRHSAAQHAAERAARAQIAAYRHRLEVQIREHARHSRHLEHRLKLLRARTADLAQAGVVLPAPVAPVAVPPATRAPVVVVPPPPPPVVAPPPPPVHTVTGASGHP